MTMKKFPRTFKNSTLKKRARRLIGSKQLIWTTKSLVSFGAVKLTSAAVPRSAVKSAESARIPRAPIRADGLTSAVTPLDYIIKDNLGKYYKIMVLWSQSGNSR